MATEVEAAVLKQLPKKKVRTKPATTKQVISSLEAFEKLLKRRFTGNPYKILNEMYGSLKQQIETQDKIDGVKIQKAKTPKL